jgi:PST family polysaccharide transporter
MKILENITWLFIDKLLRMGVGLLVGIWVARYLGPEKFGMIGFATAFIALFTTVATLGLQGPVVRDLVRHPESVNKILGTAAALQAFGGLASYLLILTIFYIMQPGDKLSLSIVAILGSMNLIKFIDIAIYWFESQVQSKYIVIAQNISFFVFAALKLWLVYIECSLMAFVWATLGEALLTGLLLMIIFTYRGVRILTLDCKFNIAKHLIQDSWPLILSSAAVMLYMRIDQIMLGKMTGPEAVGIYSAAVQISELWYFIPIILITSLFPSFVAAKDLGEGKYQRQLQKLLDLMIIISFMVAIPMTFFSETIIVALYGETYRAASSVLAINIWAGVFVFIGVASNKWFLIENKPLLNLKRALTGAITNIILNLFLIPSYGAVGAAIATVISYSIAAFFADAMQKETRFLFFMKLRSLNLIAAIYRVSR